MDRRTLALHVAADARGLHRPDCRLAGDRRNQGGVTGDCDSCHRLPDGVTAEQWAEAAYVPPHQHADGYRGEHSHPGFKYHSHS